MLRDGVAFCPEQFVRPKNCAVFFDDTGGHGFGHRNKGNDPQLADLHCERLTRFAAYRFLLFVSFGIERALFDPALSLVV